MLGASAPRANSSGEAADSASDTAATSRGPQASSIGPARVLTAPGHLSPVWTRGSPGQTLRWTSRQVPPRAYCPWSNRGRWLRVCLSDRSSGGWRPRLLPSPAVPRVAARSGKSPNPFRDTWGHPLPPLWGHGHISLFSSALRFLIVSFLSLKEGRKRTSARNSVRRDSSPLLGGSAPPFLRDESKDGAST